MATIFYDPRQRNQVMAYYDGGTSSQVWEAAGYVKAIVPSALEGEAHRLKRDAQVQLADGGAIEAFVETANPVPPEQPELSDTEKRAAELDAKLKDDTISDAEVKELLRHIRGV